MKPDPTRQTYDQFAPQIAERFWKTQLPRAWGAFQTTLPTSARILDLGSGAGRDVGHFTQLGMLAQGADLSFGLLREAQRRAPAPYTQADMRALPYAANSFDGIWMSASLLHIPKPQGLKVLQEASRLLVPGGMLYVSVKQGEGEEWETREGPRLFVYYRPDELTALVEQAGMQITEVWRDETPKHTWVNVIGMAG